MTKITVESLRKKAKAKGIPLSKDGKQKTKAQLAKALKIKLPKKTYRRRNPVDCNFAGYELAGGGSMIPATQSWTHQPYLFGGTWADEKAAYNNNTPTASLGNYPLESYPLQTRQLSDALGYSNSQGVLANRPGGYFANLGEWAEPTPSENKSLAQKAVTGLSNAVTQTMNALTGSGGSTASSAATPSITPSATPVISRTTASVLANSAARRSAGAFSR